MRTAACRVLVARISYAMYVGLIRKHPMEMLSVDAVFVCERLPSRVTRTQHETADEVGEPEGEIVPAVGVPDVEI